MIHDVLRPQYANINHKRVYRILIEPGSPTQNAYIESFNGTFRDECLDENWFESLEQARQIIATWRTDCHHAQPRIRFEQILRSSQPALNVSQDLTALEHDL